MLYIFRKLGLFFSKDSKSIFRYEKIGGVIFSYFHVHIKKLHTLKF